MKKYLILGGLLPFALTACTTTPQSSQGSATAPYSQRVPAAETIKSVSEFNDIMKRNVQDYDLETKGMTVADTAAKLYEFSGRDDREGHFTSDEEAALEIVLKTDRGPLKVIDIARTVILGGMLLSEIAIKAGEMKDDVRVKALNLYIFNRNLAESLLLIAAKIEDTDSPMGKAVGDFLWKCKDLASGKVPKMMDLHNYLNLIREMKNSFENKISTTSEAALSLAVNSTDLNIKGVDKKYVNKQILADLKPLFERAKKDNLLFFNSYIGVAFTAEQLSQLQKEGRFVWGSVNWELVPRTEQYLKQAYH